MSFQTQVIHQEVSRDYRTEAPNIVFELLKAGEISANDLVLYMVYRRIAGEHGASWVGTRGLSDMCQLSRPTITKSKKVLSKKFAMLNGKSLIQITGCDREKETSDIVTIIDIWPENHAFFKKSLTCAKIRHTGVQKDDTGVCKNKTHKKEPYKKEHPPLSSPPKKELASEAKEKSLRSEEEEIDLLEKMEETTLSPAERKRLLKSDYSTEQILQAFEISKTQTIKKSLMGLLLQILQNPEKWSGKEQNLSPEKQKSLLYNQRLAKVNPKLAKENESLIENNIIKVLCLHGTGILQLSIKAHDFNIDIKQAEKDLNEFI